MGGVLLLVGFLFCGVTLTDALLPNRQRLVRLWLGLCAGLVLMMWLPTLYAFALRFTAAAQLLGLATAALAAAAAQFATRRKPRCREWTDMPLWLLLALVVPLTVLSGYLQYTHVLRDVNGALNVGQSTYGDLCLHLGIATSLRDAAYPPTYSLLPGTLLGYPFLGDSMVTSMLLLGTPLAFAFRLTGTLMMALVYLGFALFSWELTRSRLATALAFVLMFVNGGLGFIYSLDRIGSDAGAFREIFTGFYLTPTNQPALNLRWVNVICDMMIPQRTLLTGWMALVPALWLLAVAARDRDTTLFAMLGVWAGALPMIHTHSFLALGLISAGAMAYCVLRAPSAYRMRRPHRARLGALGQFALYGVVALALALPQLMTWAVPQTLHGGALRFHFNWVNNQDGLIDEYCWFWIKNVGLVWLMMLPAALAGRRAPRRPRGTMDQRGLLRMLGLGALCVYVVAELIQFQPNDYDNNKLFYVAYMAMMPAIGAFLAMLWRKLRGIRGRALLGAAFLVVSTLSGALTIGREIVSDYSLFNAYEVEAARYVDANMPRDAVFLTGTQHKNAVAALAGRSIICGSPSYLYFHGIDYSAAYYDLVQMMERPADSAALFEKYGVTHAYISPFERNTFAVDENWFAGHGTLAFAAGDICVYELTDVHLNSTES